MFVCITVLSQYMKSLMNDVHNLSYNTNVQLKYIGSFISALLLKKQMKDATIEFKLDCVKSNYSDLNERVFNKVFESYCLSNKIKIFHTLNDNYSVP